MERPELPGDWSRCFFMDSASRLGGPRRLLGRSNVQGISKATQALHGGPDSSHWKNQPFSPKKSWSGGTILLLCELSTNRMLSVGDFCFGRHWRAMTLVSAGSVVQALVANQDLCWGRSLVEEVLEERLEVQRIEE